MVALDDISSSVFGLFILITLKSTFVLLVFPHDGHFVETDKCEPCVEILIALNKYSISKRYRLSKSIALYIPALTRSIINPYVLS